MSPRPIRALATVLCAASLLGSGSASANAPASDAAPVEEAEPSELADDSAAKDRLNAGDTADAGADPGGENTAGEGREAPAVEPEPVPPEPEGPAAVPTAAGVDGPPRKPGSTLIKVGVGVTTIGVLAGAASLVMVGMRRRAESDVAGNDGFDGNGDFAGVAAAEQTRRDAMDRGPKFETASLVLAGVAAFYLTTGIVITSRGIAARRAAQRMSLAPTASPRQVGLTLQGRF